jgi:phospholipid/cholesterol/gamma-HCH transport system substrate-binding protein
MTAWIAWIALLGVIVVVAILLLSSGASYVVNADFADAGQLVTGDQVEVGGISIGSIEGISVTQDGQADIKMGITDQRFIPFHVGTSATIRAPGVAGIANRYLAIDPGPSNNTPIADGGVLPPGSTTGIVDIDMLLDSLDKPTRQHLVGIFTNGANAFGAPADANNDFRLLDPAVSQTSLLGAELLRDQPALNAVIGSTANTLAALDAGHGDLGQTVSSLASVLETIASARGSLSDALGRTTDVLHRLEVTMGGLRATLPAVSKMLVQARPTVTPLIGLLQQVVPDTAALTPALADLRAQLPLLRIALEGFPKLARLALPALSSTTTALVRSTPIFAGLRPYTFDLMAGAITLIGAVQYSYYDALGHYARETIAGGQASLSGLLSLLPPVNFPVPSAPSYRTGVIARCPGGAAESAPDHSNPWVPSKSLCNPADDPTPEDYSSSPGGSKR